LRKASTNTGLLRACAELGAKDFTFEWADISDFPLFNEDVEAKGVPAPVKRVKDQVAKSQAILFGVPEYNSSFTAPLKNAYDWISRGDTLKEFPAGLVSVGGGAGGLNGQKQFRIVGEYFKVKFLQKP
jgi:chromate reductase